VTFQKENNKKTHKGQKGVNLVKKGGVHQEASWGSHTLAQARGSPRREWRQAPPPSLENWLWGLRNASKKFPKTQNKHVSLEISKKKNCFREENQVLHASVSFHNFSINYGNGG